MDLLEQLRWRGMIQDHTPGLPQLLGSGPQAAYIGFDPTAASLHIGSLVPIHLLVHLRKCGHNPIALVGGATGLIGDPSGKTEERKLLTEEEVRHNGVSIAAQINKLVEYYTGQPVTVVNNLDWFGTMPTTTFLREIGKLLTVNYMMSKDSVKNRLESGISFTEFSYQLLQGYDFAHLNQAYNCRLQLGGSDQWGNMTAGIELIRRMGHGEAQVLTNPLITKADGTKFGKSEAGNVWLDASLTSPYRFYQFWLNLPDEEAVRFLPIYTFLAKEETLALITDHSKAPHQRLIQRKMAEHLTIALHGKAELAQAISSSELLFGKGAWEDWQALSEPELMDLLSGLPHIQASREQDLISLLATPGEHTIFSSKGEARKMIQNGGVFVNLIKAGGDEQVEDYTALHGKYLVVQKGKKSFHLVELS